VKRVVAALVLCLLLDGLGAFPPSPYCQVAKVGDFSCAAAVELAVNALPTRISIAGTQLIDGRCVGPYYCPLNRRPADAIVMFTFGDPTRSEGPSRSQVNIYLEGGRMVAEFQFSEEIP
jgi:hypothetical protein